jgi:DNA-directed RNA polymerase specialized sigma24 family protein
MTSGTIDGSGTIEELLRRVAWGDARSAGWLYDTFAPVLLRRLHQRYGYLGEPELEDLLQETFLLVLREDGRLLLRFAERAGAAADAPSLERFLWDQACGMASNRRRSASYRKVVPISDHPDLPDPGREEQGAIDRDLIEQLDACLQGGGTRIYLYYKLRYRDGLTPEEIAEATGWSRKATYKLRQSLDEVVERCAARLGIGRP